MKDDCVSVISPFGNDQLPNAVCNQERIRLIHIDRELLRQALCLPEGTEIVGVSDQPQFGCNAITLKIRHCDFSPVSGGKIIPSITPIMSERRAFVGWHE
jgi:hypothetical protein